MTGLLGAKAVDEWAVTPSMKQGVQVLRQKPESGALRSQHLGNLGDRFAHPHQFDGLGFTLRCITEGALCSIGLIADLG